ncbi:MAG: sugar ABC transporter ATP-binding protein [Roseinatronobacter sp.]
MHALARIFLGQVAVLELNNITKTFPGARALDEARFDLRPGEVHALMGENGAGKSTLMKIAAGLMTPDRGTIRLNGQVVRLAKPSDAKAAGIHTVFQELTVLENLDVAQNLLIGREPSRLAGAWLDRAQLYRQADAILHDLGIPLDARRLVRGLSTGQRQIVEIARAVSQNPHVLILDEPTSSLGRTEEELLFALMARLKRAGTGIVYITHRMSEVFILADRITVLRDGRHILTDAAACLDRPALIRAMVGRDVSEARHEVSAHGGAIALRACGMRRGQVVRDASLTLHQGQVLGLAGLMGAGRTELARLIAGMDRPDAGEMQLFGQPFMPVSVRHAMQAGIAYVSEDRKGLGVVLSLSVGRNIALPSLSRLSRWGWLRPAAISGFAREWMARLGVKASGPETVVATLSGGNQQKVALAKSLATGPRIIILDEPTRGVDIGAKAEIYRLVRQLAQQGAAVLVISSELPELLQLCDRIAVMARGRVTGELAAVDATEEALLELAFDEKDTAA